MEQALNKKGQSGIVTGLVVGVTGLIVAVIFAFVIVQSLSDADFFTDISVTVTNESADTATITVAWLNATNYSFAQSTANNDSNTNFDLTAVWTAADTGYPYNQSLTSGYWTEYSDGTVRAANATTFANVSLTYSYSGKGDEELTQDRLTANYTEGVDNVSEQIPTILLIAAIVLILGILAVLMAVWRKMSAAGGGTL